jgi:hypothetical protein
MDFGKTLSRAWQIVWKNRVLWIFGILASCGSGGGGGGGSSNFNTGNQTGADLPPEMQRFALQIERFFETTSQETIVGWVVGIICVVVLFGLVIWAIGIFGRIGVIRGAQLADSGKSFSFGTLARESWGRLGGGLWLNFLLGLIPAAIGILLALLAGGFALAAGSQEGEFGTGLGLAVLCFIPIICILVPFFIAYSVYIQVANVAYVSDGLSASGAIRKGWEVFRSNLGNITILALILFVGGILVSIVLALPLVIVALPALVSLMANNGNFEGGGLIISGICLVIAVPLLVVANGIVQAFIHSSWTLAYAQMSTKKLVKRKTTAR